MCFIRTLYHIIILTAIDIECINNLYRFYILNPVDFFLYQCKYQIGTINVSFKLVLSMYVSNWHYQCKYQWWLPNKAITFIALNATLSLSIQIMMDINRINKKPLKANCWSVCVKHCKWWAYDNDATFSSITVG